MDCLERQGWKSRGTLVLHHDLESPVNGGEVEGRGTCMKVVWGPRVRMKRSERTGWTVRFTCLSPSLPQVLALGIPGRGLESISWQLIQRDGGRGSEECFF